MNNVVIRDETLKRTGGFVSYPKCVLRDTHELMFCTAKLAYAFMLCYAWDFQEKKLPRRNKDGSFQEFDAVQELMNDLGASEPTIRRAIKSLEDRGLIESKRRGQGKPNQFFVNPLHTLYPGDPDLSKTIDQDSDRSIVTIQEVSKTTTLDLSKTQDQAFMNNQEWSKLKEIVRDRSKMIDPNVNVNVETNDTNVNVVNKQLDFNGLPPSLHARLCQIADEICATTNQARREQLELLYRMLEQFKDIKSERFYRIVAERMPRGIIEGGLSYAKDLELTNAVKTTARRAFTDDMIRKARQNNIKITRK